MGRTKFYAKETNVYDIDFLCGFKVVSTLKGRSLAIKMHKKKCEFCRNNASDVVNTIPIVDPHCIHQKNINSMNYNNSKNLNFTLPQNINT